jgi:predicted Zn-dependent peptidase
MTGDWRPAFAHAERVRAVTAEQVLALARDVLRPENRTVVVSTPAPQATGSGAGDAPAPSASGTAARR